MTAQANSDLEELSAGKKLAIRLNLTYWAWILSINNSKSKCCVDWTSISKKETKLPPWTHKSCTYAINGFSLLLILLGLDYPLFQIQRWPARSATQRPLVCHHHWAELRDPVCDWDLRQYMRNSAMRPREVCDTGSLVSSLIHYFRFD